MLGHRPLGTAPLSSLDDQHSCQIEEVARVLEANVGDLPSRDYGRIWGFKYADPVKYHIDVVVAQLDEHVQSLVNFDRTVRDALERVVTTPPYPPLQAERLLN